MRLSRRRIGAAAGIGAFREIERFFAVFALVSAVKFVGEYFDRRPTTVTFADERFEIPE